MTFKQWLAEAMADGEISQAMLVTRTGRTSSSVTRWVNGEDLPSPESCILIARALRRSVDEVLRAAGHLPADEGMPAPTYPQPILDRITRLAQQISENVDRLEGRARVVNDSPVPYLGLGGASPVRGIDLPEALDLTRFALRVSGDCLVPDVTPGSVLVFDRERSVTAGSIVAAVVNGEVLIKRVVRVNGDWILADAKGEQVVERDNIKVWGVMVGE